MFEVKISYSLETIPEIFNEISIKIKGTAGKIFSDTVNNINKGMVAGEAFENAVYSNSNELNKEDIKSIATLGKLLGSTDVEGQINQIKLVKKFIDVQINDAIESKNKNAKMYQKLGVIIGLVIVIILI
jgi:stage III sporulation protein AB